MLRLDFWTGRDEGGFEAGDDLASNPDGLNSRADARRADAFGGVGHGEVGLNGFAAAESLDFDGVLIASTFAPSSSRIGNDK